MKRKVTEYQIIYNDKSQKEDFYTENKSEYQQEFKQSNKTDIMQCISKDYIWNKELEMYVEDYVKILYEGEK